MRVLHHHHILPLFVWIDDAVASLSKTEPKAKKKGGRPSALRDSEAVTILLFNLFTVQQHTCVRSMTGCDNTTPQTFQPYQITRTSFATVIAFNLS